MSHEDSIRAWKDAGFRTSMEREGLEAVPPNPAGIVHLSDEDLGGVSGGDINTEYLMTIGCCHGFTNTTCKCNPE